jgi:hypothetical protein
MKLDILAYEASEAVKRNTNAVLSVSCWLVRLASRSSMTSGWLRKYAVMSSNPVAVATPSSKRIGKFPDHCVSSHRGHRVFQHTRRSHCAVITCNK